MKKSFLKWVWLPLLLGAVGTYWYVKRSEGQLPQYQTAKVTRGHLEQVVTATGSLTPLTNVEVGSQISGIIKEILVDFNSPVKAGQVVARIDSAFYEADLKSAESGLASAQAALELARLNAERAETLYRDKLISKAEYDTAIAQLRQAEATVRVREAEVLRARVNVERCTIYSPVDGVVISRKVDVGQTVAASLSAPTLFVIANDLRYMQIDALVSEADIGNVSVGQPVKFTVDAYPNRTFEGAVTQVRYGPITNQGVVNYACIILVTNHDLKLLPGMTANVRIITAQRESALLIPNAALRFRPPETVTNFDAQAAGRMAAAALPVDRDRIGGRGLGFGAGRRMGRVSNLTDEQLEVRTVYVLVTNTSGKPTLKPVEIKIGITDGVNTEVVEGLAEGEEVVVGIIPTGERQSLQPNNPFVPFRRPR